VDARGRGGEGGVRAGAEAGAGPQDDKEEYGRATRHAISWSLLNTIDLVYYFFTSSRYKNKITGKIYEQLL
jgi:hypothetical protein